MNINSKSIGFFEPIRTDPPIRGLGTGLSEFCDRFVSWGGRRYIWLERPQNWVVEQSNPSKVIFIAKVIASIVFCLFLPFLLLEKFLYRKDLLKRISEHQQQQNPEDKAIIKGFIERRFEKHPSKDQILREIENTLNIAEREFESHPLKRKILGKIVSPFSSMYKDDPYDIRLDILNPHITFPYIRQMDDHAHSQKALMDFVFVKNIPLRITQYGGCIPTISYETSLPLKYLYLEGASREEAREILRTRPENPLVRKVYEVFYNSDSRAYYIACRTRKEPQEGQQGIQYEFTFTKEFSGERIFSSCVQGLFDDGICTILHAPFNRTQTLYSQEELLKATQKFFKTDSEKREILSYLTQLLLDANYIEQYQTSREALTFLEKQNVFAKLGLNVKVSGR